MLMAQISQFTSTKIAVIVHGHLMTKEHAHFMCHNLEWSLLVSCTCVVCNKCVLIGTNFVVCWYQLQTVWTQIRLDKKSGLIWLRTICHSFWRYPSKTFEMSLFWVKQQHAKKVWTSIQHAKSTTLYLLVSHEVAVCYSCLHVVLGTLYWMNVHARLGPRCSHILLVTHFLELAYTIGLSLNLHPFFLVRFAKALAILRKCTYSPDSPLFAYVTSTKLSWTGL